MKIRSRIKHELKLHKEMIISGKVLAVVLFLIFIVLAVLMIGTACLDQKQTSAPLPAMRSIRAVIDALIAAVSIVTGFLVVYTINHIVKDDEYGIPRIALFRAWRSKVLPGVFIFVGVVGCVGYVYFGKSLVTYEAAGTYNIQGTYRGTLDPVTAEMSSDGALVSSLLILMSLSYLLYQFYRLFLRTPHSMARYIEKRQPPRLEKAYEDLPKMFLENVAMAASKPENRSFAFLTYKKYILRCISTTNALEHDLPFNVFFSSYIVFEHARREQDTGKDFIRYCFVPVVEELLAQYGNVRAYCREENARQSDGSGDDLFQLRERINSAFAGRALKMRQALVTVLAQWLSAAVALSCDHKGDKQSCSAEWRKNLDQLVFDEERESLWKKMKDALGEDYQQFLAFFLLILEGFLHMSVDGPVAAWDPIKVFPGIIKDLHADPFVMHGSVREAANAEALHKRFAIIMDVHDILQRHDNHERFSLQGILNAGFENLIMDKRMLEASSLLPQGRSILMQMIVRNEERTVDHEYHPHH